MTGLGLSPLMMKAAGADYLADRLPLYAETAEERLVVDVMWRTHGLVLELEGEVERVQEEVEDAESEKSYQERRADDAFELLRRVRDELGDAGERLPEVAEAIRLKVVKHLKDEGEA